METIFLLKIWRMAKLSCNHVHIQLFTSKTATEMRGKNAQKSSRLEYISLDHGLIELVTTFHLYPSMENYQRVNLFFLVHTSQHLATSVGSSDCDFVFQE
jgi:hypothetical protein